MIEVLALIWSGALFMAAGVCLGGFLVYRTKRPGETVFINAEEPTGPVNIDEMVELPEEDEEPGSDPLDIVAMEQNVRFLKQFAKDKMNEQDTAPEPSKP